LQVAVAYDAHGENVISNFDLKIAPTEKIAIVGRTGAGKVSILAFHFLCFHYFFLPFPSQTSLMLALFRMIPITKGSIIIDGIDIMDIRNFPPLFHPFPHCSYCSSTSLAVPEMRRKISIVPADPILFNTSIRENLDPFEIHKDNEIWAALDKVRSPSFRTFLFNV